MRRGLVKVIKWSFLTYSTTFSMKVCVLDVDLWLGFDTSHNTVLQQHQLLWKALFGSKNKNDIKFKD